MIGTFQADWKSTGEPWEHVAREEAAPIAKEDLDFARKLLERIGPYLPFEPDAAPGTDGSICMEWVSDATVGSKKIFVDVAPGGAVLTYSRLGNYPPSEKHFKKGELDRLCSLDFHFKEVNNRFKKLGL